MKNNSKRISVWMQNPITQLFALHIFVVITLCALTAITDYIYYISYNLSTLDKIMVIFFSNFLSFVGAVITAFKILDLAYSYVPDKYFYSLFLEVDEENEDTSESPAIASIPIKELVLILTLISLTVISITSAFYHHIDFADKLLNVNFDHNSYAMIYL